MAATDVDWGATALHRAAYGGHVEMCWVLLAAGAEVDAGDDDGFSALKRWRRCFGEISGCQEFRTQHVKCRGFGE